MSQGSREEGTGLVCGAERKLMQLTQRAREEFCEIGLGRWRKARQ